MKLASIIITTYNRPLLLTKALLSALNQEYNNIEVIVVDDNGKGSRAQLKTKKNIEKYLTKSNFTYLILEKNIGGSLARNEGAKIAKGKYLFFLDDDDEFLSNKVIQQVTFLERNKQYDGCLASFIRKDKNKNISASSNKPCVGNFINFVINGNFFTPMLCINKRQFNQVGGFKKIDRFQDRYFMLHCLKDNLKFGIIEQPLHVMYEHSDERVSSVSIKRSISSLDVIKQYIDDYRDEFTPKEWKKYIEKDNTMRGVLYYVSDNYISRLHAIKYWIKNILINPKLKQFIMITKTLFPKKNKI